MKASIFPFFLVVAMGMLLSCKHHHHHDHQGHDHEHEGHDHGDEEETIGITHWTETHELFAEHPPASVGKEVSFLAHITELKEFRPVAEGHAVLTLEGPTKVQAKAEMVQPGIFRSKFQPRLPGTYRASFSLHKGSTETTIDGFELVVHAKEPEATPQEKSSATTLSFTKEKQWQIPFGTAFAVEKELSPSLELGAEVTTPPGGQADVGAPVQGRLVPHARGLPRPGQSVKKGQLLASIAPTPSSPEGSANAQLAIAEANARLDAARRQQQRAERLLKDQAISEREVEDAKREMEVAEAVLRAAKATSSVFQGATSGAGAGVYRIVAPMDGVITQVEASPGKSVSAGELLFRIVDLRELWIHTRVPEQDAHELVLEGHAFYQLAQGRPWHPIQGGVIHVGRIVDPKSRTVDLIYGLSSPDETLRVGGRVRIRIPVGSTWKGIALADEAVIEKDGRPIVMVQVEGETFEERTVSLGPRSGPYVGIVRGVNVGERVVTRGANILRLSVQAGQGPAQGHVH